MARNSTPPSSLVISVDVELSRVACVDSDQAQHVSLVDHRSRVESLQQLLQAFDQAQVPATWGFSDPARSHFIPALVNGTSRHEVALLGDMSWISPEAGRRSLCQQLVQRISQAQEAGVELSTLALYDGQLSADYDLLAKQQISMVRHPRTKSPSRKQASRRRSLRYGLWEAPAAVSLSPTSLLVGRRPGHAINRLMRRMDRQGGVGHLLLDLTGEKDVSSRGLKLVNRILHAISKYQRSAQLQICTLRDLALQWQPSQQGVTARSLLRVAA